MAVERGVVRISPTPEEVAQAAAEIFHSLVPAAIAARGQANVVLTGGSSPGKMYDLLAHPDTARQYDWTKIHLWFSDERCVPPENELSNYLLAKQHLIDHVPVPSTNVHRMQGELGEAGAPAYEQELRQHFQLAPGALPRFDLTILGLGPDGHVASMFPGSPALDVTDKLVAFNPHDSYPPPPVNRLTLTMPVLNAGAFVFFQVTGADKAGLVAKVLGPDERPPLPAQGVHPTNGQLLWLLDVAVAGELPAE